MWKRWTSTLRHIEFYIHLELINIKIYTFHSVNDFIKSVESHCMELAVCHESTDFFHKNYFFLIRKNTRSCRKKCLFARTCTFWKESFFDQPKTRHYCETAKTLIKQVGLLKSDKKLRLCFQMMSLLTSSSEALVADKVIFPKI